MALCEHFIVEFRHFSYFWLSKRAARKVTGWPETRFPFLSCLWRMSTMGWSTSSWPRCPPPSTGDTAARGIPAPRRGGDSSWAGNAVSAAAGGARRWWPAARGEQTTGEAVNKHPEINDVRVRVMISSLSGAIRTPGLRPSTCPVTPSPARPRGSSDPGARVASRAGQASRLAASRVASKWRAERRSPCPRATVPVTTATWPAGSVHWARVQRTHVTPGTRPMSHPRTGGQAASLQGSARGRPSPASRRGYSPTPWPPPRPPDTRRPPVVCIRCQGERLVTTPRSS